MLQVLDKLNEITHSGIARKQRSITRLFPEFPARVKSIGSKGGIRLLEILPDLWHFKVHSGTQDGVWYDTYIKYKDMVEFLSNTIIDKRLWTKDKNHVDLKKLAKKVMFYCQIQVKCTCPAFQYWGPAYIMSLSKYDAHYGDRENRPPKIRNPRQYGAVCKHVQAMLNVYPFYITTLAGFLRDYHTDQIRYLEGEAKKEGEGFKKAAAKLGQKKKAREEELKEPETPEETEESPESEEEPRESIVKEDFEDLFQPTPKDEIENRNKAFFDRKMKELGNIKVGSTVALKKDDRLSIYAHKNLSGAKSYSAEHTGVIVDKDTKFEVVQIDKNVAQGGPYILIYLKFNPEDDSPPMYIYRFSGEFVRDFEFVDESVVKEDFEDTFEPASKDEVDNRHKKEDSGFQDRLGDCYRLSGRYVIGKDDVTLVHGTINGIRMTGKDFDNPHAWVEEGDEVYDLVWDERFPKEVYYTIMSAKVNQKYDDDQAAKAMLKAGHWGPWDGSVPDVKWDDTVEEMKEDFKDIFKPISGEEDQKRKEKYFKEHASEYEAIEKKLANFPVGAKVRIEYPMLWDTWDSLEDAKENEDEESFDVTSITPSNKITIVDRERIVGYWGPSVFTYLKIELRDSIRYTIVFHKELKDKLIRIDSEPRSSNEHIRQNVA